MINTNSTRNAGAMKITTLIEFSYEKLFFLIRLKKSRIKFDKPKQIKKHKIPIRTVDMRDKKSILIIYNKKSKANK